jgi:hypothetical protein
VRLESLLISLFGAIEGLVLGILFGWAIVAAAKAHISPAQASHTKPNADR